MADIEALLAVMARLRDPRGGCPWDLEQDFASISPHTIEEAYEVDEAIAQGDLAGLRDELGDLLFQVVFQARLAEEQGLFDFSGVVEAIVEKLVRRHPHVFSDAEAPTTVEGQRATWEEIKAAERAERQPDGRPPDPFAGIPRSLPALARSAKLAGRLERLGRGEATDSEAGSPALSELVSERMASLANIARALELSEPQSGQDAPIDPASEPIALTRDWDVVGKDELARLVGEGIRDWVRIARLLGVDPEQALRRVDDERVAEILSNAHQASSSRRR